LDLGEDGAVAIVPATVPLAFAAAAAWASGARERLVTWSWPKLIDRCCDGHALVSARDRARALWCSHRGILKLPAGPTYELAYIEVHPDDRGTTVGLYAIAAAATRALELGATGMVLASVPERGVRRRYEYAGGISGKVKGWQTHPSLIPYYFPEHALAALQEDLNAARKKSP